MRKIQLLAFTLLCAIGIAQAQTKQELQTQFQHPGKEARPMVWWHWMNGNVTKDGIRKDLLWMHRIGISGLHTFDAGLSTPKIVDKRLIYMDEGWKDAFKYAIQLTDSLDLQVGIASSPGWSATGGPWVKLEEGMKKVVWREITINSNGKKEVSVKLPDGYDTPGNFQNSGAAGGLSSGGSRKAVLYKDIAILAYRLPAASKTLAQLNAKVTSNTGTFSLDQLTDGDLGVTADLPIDSVNGFSWIQYEFPEAVTIKAIAIDDSSIRAEWEANQPDYKDILLASNDGVNFTEVCKIPAGGVALRTITIPVTTARYFRLQIPNPPVDTSLVMYGGAPRQPQSTKIAEFNLFTETRINHAEEKAGFAAIWDLQNYVTPEAGNEETIKKSDIIDITDKMDAEGNLTWKAPAGEWKILRLGYSLTGKQNHPAPTEATGLEVDKLDPIAWTNFFHTYLDMYKDVVGADLIGKRGIQYVLTDSYEAGQENWTPAMMQEFRNRRGYDLLPWMPVLTGQIVNSTQESEKFLWDWRTTIGELIAENYDRLTIIAQQEYGMEGRYSESHENGRLYLVDGMDVKRTAQIPMSAIWMPGGGGGSAIPMATADIRESASVAHIYGQNIAAAESMTAIGYNNLGWSYHPGNLKPVVDLEFANGLNRIVVHESAHQPVDDKKPGLGLMIFGQWFNRHETWAEQAKAWTDYIARSCYLLQQGRFVADVLYYYGEDNNITGLFGNYLPTIGNGYNYDFINPDALLNQLSACCGKLMTKSGMEYRVLYLDPNVKRMSLPVLRKLAELAHAGVIISGAVPHENASLDGDPNEFQRLVNDIWFAGRTNVLQGQTIDETLKTASVAPDFQYGSTVPGLNLRYVHRTLENGEIYWVNNPNDQFVQASASFRVTGKKPQIWHAETGKMEEASYRIADGRTVVELNMTPQDAQFVIFIDEATQDAVTLPAKTYTDLLTVSTPWQVTFDGLGAPEPQVFSELKSYTESDNFKLKYFSGTATYTNTVKLDKKQLARSGSLLLELGDVKNLAEVIVNGQNLGIVWKEPFYVDATEALKVGDNTIEIKVVNSWVNRLIGDEQPDAEKVTYTSAKFYNAESPLKPSGLLGPVKVVVRN